MIGIYGSEKASETVLMHLSWLGGYNENKLLATVEYDVYFVEDGIIKSMTKTGFIEKYKSSFGVLSNAFFTLLFGLNPRLSSGRILIRSER